MTDAKLDPKLCRRLATHLTEWPVQILDLQREAATQLTAAADLAEKHERDTAALHRDLCAERNAVRAHLADRTLTEERVREVVKRVLYSAMQADGPTTTEEEADAIATSAAKDLSGAVVESRLLDDIRALRISWSDKETTLAEVLADVDRLLACSLPEALTEQINPVRCHQDPTHDSAWCAVHDECPDWHSEVRGYTGPAGWICASGGLFDDKASEAARRDFNAKCDEILAESESERLELLGRLLGDSK